MDGNEIAQDERPGEGLVGDAVLERVGDDGHRHGDALVAAAAVAHCGERASSHAGVGSCGGKAHRIAHQVVAEHFQLVLPDGLAYAEAIVSVQAFFREGEVQRAVFQDEPDVLEIGRAGEVVDFPDGKPIVQRRAVLDGGAGFGTHQDAVRETGFHDLVVVVLDDGVGVGMDFRRSPDAFAHRHGGLHVQEVVRIGPGAGDALGRHQYLGAGDSAVRYALEDLQPAARVAAHGAERGRDGQAHHAGPGDAHAHPVLEDVAAHFHGDAEIGRLPPQGAVAAMRAVLGDDVHGLRDGEGDGDGFGTAQGGLHFLVDQFDEFGLAVSHGFLGWGQIQM